MWTCGSINPGKTYLPAASTISVPGGTSRSRPMRVIVSSWAKMSACERESAVIISPLRMSKGMGGQWALVDLNALLLAIFFHGLPVRGDCRPRFAELFPRDRRAPGVDLDHADATIDRADVVAEPAPDAILLAHARLRAQGIDRDVVNALMRGVVA